MPKVHPPVSIEKDFRPISLTPIAAKVFESIVVKWVDDSLLSEIDDKQFGGITGTSTIDALVEMANMWYEATDKLDVFVRVILLDFSKAFDLINHIILKACAQRFRYALFAFIHTQTYFEYYTLTLRLASLVKKTVIYAYWTKELFDICRENV